MRIFLYSGLRGTGPLAGYIILRRTHPSPGGSARRDRGGKEGNQAEMPPPPITGKSSTLLRSSTAESSYPGVRDVRDTALPIIWRFEEFIEASIDSNG